MFEVALLVLAWAPSGSGPSVLYFSVMSSGEEFVFRRRVFPWSWCNGAVLVLIMANLQVLGRFSGSNF